MPNFDVVVVGLGAAGAATAYQLAKRGVSVLGIDQLSPPHAQGSTHGDSRITRQAVGEGTAYVPLVVRSNELWRDIEDATGEDLFTVTGGLIIGSPRGSGVTHGKTDFVGRTIAAAREFGIEHEVLSSGQIRSRFPQFLNLRDEIGYLEPGAGFLRPERCVSAQLKLAREHGATLHSDERVLTCRSAGDGVAVVSNRAKYHAGRAVLCAGPWIGQLVDAQLARLFSVQRQVMYWFDVSTAYESYAPGAFPVFVWDLGGKDTVLYGVPAIGGPDGGVKVATEWYGDATDPDGASRTVAVAEIEAMYETGVRARFAGVGPRCVKAQTCLYTCTADFDFVIDNAPARGEVLLVSACSGHGFKHSAAIGESVAQRLLEGSSAIDLSAFGLSRLTSIA